MMSFDLLQEFVLKYVLFSGIYGNFSRIYGWWASVRGEKRAFSTLEIGSKNQTMYRKPESAG